MARLTAADNWTGMTYDLGASDHIVVASLLTGLSYKYGRYFEDSRGNGHSDLSFSSHWCTAGSVDFLRFQRFGELGQAGEIEYSMEQPWADQRQLILIPFRNSLTLPDGISIPLSPPSLLPLLESPELSPLAPMLVMIRVTVSPLAYQLHLDERVRSRPVLRVLRNLINSCLLDKLLVQHSKRGGLENLRTGIYGCLSGPDIVILHLMSRPDELQAVHQLTHRLRTLRLAELYSDEPTAISMTRNHPQFPGHACVDVSPCLAFRAQSHAYFDTEDFRKEEERTGIRYHFRLRVDCGHEAQVTEDLAESLPSGSILDGLDQSFEGVRSPLIYWDSHSVRGSFLHLADFARTWVDKWFEKEWRENNLLDSSTVISFSDGRFSWREPESRVELSEQIRNRLRSMSQNIRSFSQCYLNPTRQAELSSIYDSFLSCFYRHELLGTAIDLLPFFDQVSRALKCAVELQGRLHDPELGAAMWQSFEKGFYELQKHALRAVINRIEHRVPYDAIQFPQTLRDGGCRLISAYSAAARFCADLLLTDPSETLDPFADKSEAAVCLHSGGDGRICCAELFRDFRLFVEKDLRGGELLSSSNEKTAWKSRLIVIDISGQPLFHPEVAVAHFLHELAEASCWIELDQASSLRSGINIWVLREITDLICQEYAEVLTGGSENSALVAEQFRDEIGDDLIRFAYVRRRRDLRRQSNSTNHRVWKKDDWTREIQFLEEDSDFLKCHPLAVLESIGEAILHCATELPNDLLGEFAEDTGQEIGEEIGEEASRRALRIATNSGTLRSIIAPLTATLCEIIPDTAMWMAMSHLLADKLRSGDTAGPEHSKTLRFSYLTKIFRSIFVLADQASGCAGIVETQAQSLCLRFMLQSSAILGNDWKEEFQKALLTFPLSEKTKRQVFSEKMELFISEWAEMGAYFSHQRTGSLAALLGAYSHYSGHGSSGPQFAGISTDNDNGSESISLSCLVRSLQNAWEKQDTSSRLDLALLLWACSVQLPGGQRLLEQRDRRRSQQRNPDEVTHEE